MPRLLRKELPESALASPLSFPCWKTRTRFEEFLCSGLGKDGGISGIGGPRGGDRRPAETSTSENGRPGRVDSTLAAPQLKNKDLLTSTLPAVSRRGFRFRKSASLDDEYQKERTGFDRDVVDVLRLSSRSAEWQGDQGASAGRNEGSVQVWFMRCR